MGEATTFLKRAYRWTNRQKPGSNVPQAATAPYSGTKGCFCARGSTCAGNIREAGQLRGVGRAGECLSVEQGHEVSRGTHPACHHRGDASGAEPPAERIDGGAAKFVTVFRAGEDGQSDT